MSVYDLIKNTNIITINQGSDYADTVTVTQTAGGAAVDLTGYTVSSKLKTLDGSLAATFVSTIPNPATGVVVRSIAGANTKPLTPATSINHVWGIQLTSPGGALLPEIKGGAFVSPEVVE